MATVTGITVGADGPEGTSAPDSVTLGGGYAWGAYTNGADSTGLKGSSTVVQYDSAGNALLTYTLPGYVDGLKYDPYTGIVWALQNQDGNSTLSLINPATNSVSGPLSYSPGSATRGYDDVVFTPSKVFLSYTNPPGTSGDPVIVSLDQGNHPAGTLTTTTVLTDSTLGTNTVTGQTNQMVPETDPDSLKLAPDGSLLLSSNNDGDIIRIANPGTAQQSVSFTPIQGVTPGNAGLDDVIQTNAGSGTFIVADGKDNRYLTIHVNGLNPNDYYGSVGSLGAFGQIDPKTGIFTPLLSAANAPGFAFGSPHGVSFVADAAAAQPTVTDVTVAATAPAGSTSPDSVDVGGGYGWVAYTNGADSTGLKGSSTVVQYDVAGNALHSYTLAGYVDGLKFDPYTGVVWALQNQDGNSTLSLINPTTHAVSGPLSYSPGSATRGYDDVVFTPSKVFLSYTNPPGTSGDPVIVSLDQGNHPAGTLTTSTVLTDSTLGTNTVTGQTNQVVPETDPDSLKQAPDGSLIFSSGNDGDIIRISHPGTAQQSVSFTPIQGVTPGNAGLDDVIQTNATSGTFLIADTGNNRVLSVHVNGLNPNDYYASVGSLFAFGQVDPKTGIFTPLVSAANTPGFSIGAPHGIAFIPDSASVSSVTATPASPWLHAPLTGAAAFGQVSELATPVAAARPAFAQGLPTTPNATVPAAGGSGLAAELNGATHLALASSLAVHNPLSGWAG